MSYSACSQHSSNSQSVYAVLITPPLDVNRKSRVKIGSRNEISIMLPWCLTCQLYKRSGRFSAGEGKSCCKVGSVNLLFFYCLFRLLHAARSTVLEVVETCDRVSSFLSVSFGVKIYILCEGSTIRYRYHLNVSTVCSIQVIYY